MFSYGGNGGRNGADGDGCIWTLTADTHIISFTGDASQIKSNGHRLYLNGKEMSI